MKYKEIVDWVNSEFDKFDERTQKASKSLLKTYGSHYRNVALTALRELKR